MAASSSSSRPIAGPATCLGPGLCQLRCTPAARCMTRPSACFGLPQGQTAWTRSPSSCRSTPQQVGRSSPTALPSRFRRLCTFGATRMTRLGVGASSRPEPMAWFVASSGGRPSVRLAPSQYRSTCLRRAPGSSRFRRRQSMISVTSMRLNSAPRCQRGWAAPASVCRSSGRSSFAACMDPGRNNWCNRCRTHSRQQQRRTVPWCRKCWTRSCRAKPGLAAARVLASKIFRSTSPRWVARCIGPGRSRHSPGRARNRPRRRTSFSRCTRPPTGRSNTAGVASASNAPPRPYRSNAPPGYWAHREPPDHSRRRHTNRCPRTRPTTAT
jgi:hypothetical protein